MQSKAWRMHPIEKYALGPHNVVSCHSASSTHFIFPSSITEVHFAMSQEQYLRERGCHLAMMDTTKEKKTKGHQIKATKGGILSFDLSIVTVTLKMFGMWWGHDCKKKSNKYKKNKTNRTPISSRFSGAFACMGRFPFAWKRFQFQSK